MEGRSRSETATSFLLGVAVGAGGLAFLTGVHTYQVRSAVPGPPAVPALDAPLEVEGPAADEPADLPLEGVPADVAWDIANIDHPRVDYWIRRFQTDRRERFEAILRRKGAFEPMIRAALRERGMPQDLVYLAMVESGFQTKAYSPAHASGIWQFIRTTALRYGLEINRAVDERNDPEKATTAALRYLSHLHRRFGSWYLAAAAYNSGETRVARVMRRRTGKVRGTDGDYYRIWRHLPGETREYVPVMIAAARISKDPARYGFHGVTALEPWRFEEVLTAPATSLAALARRAGTTVAAIRELNPHLRIHRTRNDRSMTVRLPLPPAEGEVGGDLAEAAQTLVAD